MAWDLTTPADDDNVSSGPGEIRTFKTDMQTALQVEHNFPVAAGTPAACHKLPYGNTASRPAAGNANRWYYDTTTQTIQRDTGSGWENIVAPKGLVPSGTKMPFGQASAPTGWTKDVSNDDKMLRVVSGSGGGSGGSWAVPTDSKSHAHTMTTANLSADHPATNYYMWPTGNPFYVWGKRSENAENCIDAHNYSHAHSISTSASHEHLSDGAWRPAYLDVIVCTKD